MHEDEDNPFEYPANAQEVLPLPQRKVFKRSKNYQEFHEIDLFDDMNETSLSPEKKKACTEAGSMAEVAGQLKLIIPTLATLTKDVAEMKKAQNQNSSLNRSNSLDRSRSQVFESRRNRINALEIDDPMDYEQTQSQSQSQSDTSTPKSSASQSSSVLEESYEGSRSRSRSRQREQPREDVRGGFGQTNWKKKSSGNDYDNRTRRENTYQEGGEGRSRGRGRGRGRGGRASDRRHEGDDVPFSDMSKGEVYRMFNQICNNAHTQAEKSKEFAVREVIISGQEESKDDLSLAVAAIQTVIPSIVRSDIYMVSRFQRPDETSFRPLKAVFYRESLAKEVVETVESSEANRQKFDYIRRGLTWRQRAANSRARNYVEEKNLDIPVGHPDRWEIQQVGGFQIAVQPVRQKEKMKANTYQRPRGQATIRNSNPKTNQTPNDQRITRDRAPPGEPKPSTSGQALKKKTTSTKVSVTSADAEAALTRVNTVVASTNPGSRKKTPKSIQTPSSGTSKGGKAKRSKTPRVPDASLMTTAEKKRMHKQLGEDLMNLPSTRSNHSGTY